MKLFYKDNFSSLTQLASDIEVFSSKNHIPQATTYALNLCLDEVLTNIISYGRKNKSQNCHIEIDLSVSNNRVIAIVRDTGIPFNPIQNSPSSPNLRLPIEDRSVGGLGVYFLEQYMDKVEYKREHNQNVLTLTKLIN